MNVDSRDSERVYSCERRFIGNLGLPRCGFQTPEDLTDAQSAFGGGIGRRLLASKAVRRHRRSEDFRYRRSAGSRLQG